MRLLSIGLLLVTSTSYSAPSLDGEMPVPAAFKPEYMLPFSYCNLGSDRKPHDGALVLACTSSSTTATCSVLTAADMPDALTTKTKPKRALKFTISAKGKSSVLTSQNQKIKIVLKDDKIAQLDHEPWGMYQQCDYGENLTMADWKSRQDKELETEALAESMPTPPPQSSARPPSAKPTAPAAKKGKGLGQMCNATSECEGQPRLQSAE